MTTHDKKISEAMIFASEAHDMQTDDNGNPHFWHCVQEAEIIKIVAPKDTNLICAAYLHDVIEDTAITHERLSQEFGPDIADLVNEVTHEGESGSYYFPRLHSERGIVLKFADRTSNLSRMKCWDEEKKAEYIKGSTFWKDSK